MNITELPDEILEKIFLDVSNSGGYLKKLTESCKKFNSLIGSSVKLMERMILNWDVAGTKNVDILFTSKRNYRCIKVDNLSYKRADKRFDPLLLYFIQNQKSSIDTIQIRNEEYLLSELETLFKIVESNLKSISIDNIKCINDKEISTMNFPKLKVLSTFSGSFDLYCHLFKEANNIEEFMFDFQETSLLFKPFIMEHKSITKLSLSFCELLISDMENILMTFGENLTTISLSSINVANNMEAYPMNLPKLNSITLDPVMEEDPIITANLLRFFLYASNVEDLIFLPWRDLADPGLRQVFRGILVKFTKLKQLTVFNYLSALFEDNFLCKETTFNLNELELYIALLGVDDHVIQRYPTYHDYIVSFIMKQKLKNLTLARMHLTGDIISSVLAMDSLKSLTIKNCSFESLPQEITANYSVQMMSISYSNDNDDGKIQGLIILLSSCLNVRELILDDIVITNKVSTAIAEQMKNLRRLKINHCKIPTPIAYPSVTSIEIHASGYGTFFNDIIEVVRVNPQVKCLKMPAQVKFHPTYHFVMKELHLDELYLYDGYKGPFEAPPTTLMKNLDNLMFMPFVLLFMYMFYLFVLFTSSDSADYNM